MIRTYQQEDLDRIMELWLNTNLIAHDFIKPDYWYQHQELVRERMPEAEIYVVEEQGQLKGFLGLVEGYIAGIFVDESAQSMGIGKKLLTHCKQQYKELSLHVYEKNRRARKFYEREAFVAIEKHVEEETQETEYLMVWKRNIDG